jgi:RNA polymerase sigma-70 factor (ECF subfamily)
LDARDSSAARRLAADGGDSPGAAPSVNPPADAPLPPAIDPVVLEWVLAARAGDQDAFAELVYAYQDAVYNLCYRMLSERTEAEDAAQETFLRAYLHLDRYDPGRSFKTWLLSIASNYCIDRLRRRRMHYLSIDEDPLPALTLSTHEPEPEDEVIRAQHSQVIQMLLKLLPADYRAAVILRYWYDYSYVEIADILQTTESAIKSRLFRARQMLADKLGSSAHGLTPLLEML